MLEARNYLYLWVYAHHKVIYYANFLIPVITKEIAQYCGKYQRDFPSWELNYDNLDKLDDYYIWTAIKYIHNQSKPIKLKKEYADLIEQLFSRAYNRSLYKSLAEFELVFNSFTTEQKLTALDEILPISQIRLLSEDHITEKNTKEKYFYLYYKENNAEATPEKTRIIKEAIKKYLAN